MRRIAVGLLILLLMACAASSQSISNRSSPLVVLLSIDGLKPDYVIEADRHGLKVPHLRRLFAAGAHAGGVQGVLPTVTYPSHTTMLTGVAPARHGIFYNTTFDPLHKNYDGWYWYAEDIRVPTLWDAATKAGLITASIDWPVSVSAPVTYNIAQVWRASTPDDRKLIRALSSPGLVAEAERAVGPFAEGNDYTIDGDRRRAAFIAWLLENKKPQFVTCYFGALDTDEHEAGPYSAKAFATLEALDALVGQVWQAAERVSRRNVVFCVVSDHGFIRVDKALRLNIALREAGLIEADAKGNVKSWRAIAWNGGGSSAIMLKEAGDVEARQKARATLARLAADPAGGVLRVIETTEAQQMGGFPEAAFVVCARPGYAISTSLEGTVIGATKIGGTHGYFPELHEMDSAFFIAGPGISAGRDLARIDMRDIAPTLAALLGVKLPAAEGRDVLGQASR
jgi:predicted AlkP superfamily pyrophosphatase or phosphodiesterase